MSGCLIIQFGQRMDWIHSGHWPNFPGSLEQAHHKVVPRLSVLNLSDGRKRQWDGDGGGGGDGVGSSGSTDCRVVYFLDMP